MTDSAEKIELKVVKSDDPEKIYLSPKCCSDPSEGRLWSIDDHWTDEGLCEDHVKATEYTHSDLCHARVTGDEVGRAIERLDTALNAGIVPLAMVQDVATVINAAEQAPPPEADRQRALEASLQAAADVHGGYMNATKKKAVTAAINTFAEYVMLGSGKCTISKPHVGVEVTVEELSVDMQDALHNYKILQGHFGDSAAKILIRELFTKYNITKKEKS